MGNWELCRICTKCIKNDQAQRLFDRNHCKLVRKIEEITGVRLKNLKQLPQYMCKPCRKDLEKAYEFRERCIAAQKYFSTVDNEEQRLIVNENVNAGSGDKFELKDELPLEENHSEVICLVKEESCEEFYEGGAENSVITNDYNCQNNLKNKLVDFNAAADKMEVEVPINNMTTLEVESKLKTKRKYPKLKEKQSYRIIGKLKISSRRQKTDDKQHNFICDQCGNNFTCKHHFKTHLRRHTGDKQFQCELCPDKFFTHSELNRHMRRHTGERPFACKHCERRFSDFSTRIKHERTHTNERPFVCPQCSKAFTTSYILKNHMLIHTGERSFKCDLCNKAFQRQTHLDVHFRSIMHKQKEEKQISRVE